MELGYQAFDGDNHYYEALDAFTRHLDPKLGPRVIEWVEVNGRRYHALGGRVSRAVTNPTFDPIAPAGALVDYFRGNPEGRPMHELMGKAEPIRPEYRDRDARLATMDAQGLARVWLFPTLGMLYEESLKHDPGAVVLLFRAFNRWLAEDWGMAYRDRIFAAPYITLADVDEAVRELEWALDQDARAVVLRAAAPITVAGPLSPAADAFDPFWARVNESGTRVAVHLGGAEYQKYGADWGENPRAKYSEYNAFQWISYWSDRPIMDTVTAMVFHNLFGRFPEIKVLIAEFGTPWLPYLVRKLDHAALLGRKPKWGTLPARPSRIFKEHFVVAPFPEENISRPMEIVGSDCLVFGSDFPHSEGLPDPVQYASQLKGLDQPTVRKIMRDNLANFLATG